MDLTDVFHFQMTDLLFDQSELKIHISLISMPFA